VRKKTQSSAGAELARDDGGSVNTEPADTPLSRASKLAPTRIAFGFGFCSGQQGSTHTHQLPNPFEQFYRTLNQLGKKRVIFIHVALVLGKVAPLMA